MEELAGEKIIESWQRLLKIELTQEGQKNVDLLSGIDVLADYVKKEMA